MNSLSHTIITVIIVRIKVKSFEKSSTILLEMTPSYEESYRRLNEPAEDVVSGGDVKRNKLPTLTVQRVRVLLHTE